MNFINVFSSMSRLFRNNSGAQKGRKNYSTSLTRGQALQVKKMIARTEELKYFSYTNTTVGTWLNVTTTPSITGVPFDIAQGITGLTRVGDSINWCGHIDLRFKIENGTGAADVFNNVRIAVVQWFANQTPVSTDVFYVGPSTAVDIYSVYNHVRRHEYMVLFDKCFKTVGNQTGASNPAMSNVTTGSLYFKIPLTKARKHVEYTAGAITGTNRFYLFLVSDSASANPPRILYSTKVVYRDA